LSTPPSDNRAVYWYLEMLQLHVGLVVGSVLLFVIRGAGSVAGMAWPMDDRLRTLGGGIDFLLTLVGLSLWALIGVSLSQQPWMVAKLLLLFAYIGVANLTLRGPQSLPLRLLGYLSALACLGLMVLVSRSRDAFAGLVG
jgi:uncharacterized membrane protein SirB2